MGTTFRRIRAKRGFYWNNMRILVKRQNLFRDFCKFSKIWGFWNLTVATRRKVSAERACKVAFSFDLLEKSALPVNAG